MTDQKYKIKTKLQRKFLKQEETANKFTIDGLYQS